MSAADTRQNYNLFIMNADGSGLETVTTNTAWDNVDPTWSLDGTKIALTAYYPLYDEDPFYDYSESIIGFKIYEQTASAGGLSAAAASQVVVQSGGWRLEFVDYASLIRNAAWQLQAAGCQLGLSGASIEVKDSINGTSILTTTPNETLIILIIGIEPISNWYRIQYRYTSEQGTIQEGSGWLAPIFQFLDPCQSDNDISNLPIVDSNGNLIIPTPVPTPTPISTAIPTPEPFTCPISLDPYATVFTSDHPNAFPQPTSLTQLLFTIFSPNDGLITRTEIDRLRQAYNADQHITNNQLLYALGDHLPGPVSDPSQAFALSRIGDWIQVGNLSGSPTNSFWWMFSGYGLAFPGCTNPPVSTSVDAFVFDTDGVMDTTQFTALFIELDNSLTSPHPLDTSIDNMFLRDYVASLTEYSDYGARCPASDTNCSNRVATRMQLEAENRFNEQIMAFGTVYQIPPMLLKWVLMEESQLRPALIANGGPYAGAIGIAQFEQIAAAQMILNYGFDDTPEARIAYWYGMDGIPGSSSSEPLGTCEAQYQPSGNPSSSPTSEQNCVDFTETVNAIQDAGNYLNWEKVTIDPAILSIGDAWNNLGTNKDQKYWELIVAGYNLGPSGVAQAIRAWVEDNPNYSGLFSFELLCPYVNDEPPGKRREVGRYVHDFPNGTVQSAPGLCS